MKGITKNVLKILDEELLGYIVNDTKELIVKTQENMLKCDESDIAEIDRVWEIAQNVHELYFMYSSYIETKPKCYLDGMILMGKLHVFCQAVSDKYSYSPDSKSRKPKIVDELDDFVGNLLSDNPFNRNYYFTEKDIQEYKTKLNNIRNG